LVVVVVVWKRACTLDFDQQSLRKGIEIPKFRFVPSIEVRHMSSKVRVTFPTAR
jgi:hypothetical protein